MNKHTKGELIEPFFITEEIESEMVARGYVSTPPGHARTISLPEILAGLSDQELDRRQDDLADEERKKRLQQR